MCDVRNPSIFMYVSFRNIYVNKDLPDTHQNLQSLETAHFVFKAREVQGRSEKIHYQLNICTEQYRRLAMSKSVHGQLIFTSECKATGFLRKAKRLVEKKKRKKNLSILFLYLCTVHYSVASTMQQFPKICIRTNAF